MQKSCIFPIKGSGVHTRPRGAQGAIREFTILLNANPKDAQVFLDGAYAGTAEHLKDMWLDSGAYDLSVSSPGKETFRQRIYVISGKKLKIDARLTAQKENAPTEEKR